jgi:hypothetical protein
MRLQFNSQALSMFETPWLRRQVQSHLVFGPLSKYLAVGWVMLFIAAALFIKSLLAPLSAIRITENIDKLFFILVAVLLLRMPKYHQAALGWCVIKITLGLLAFLMLLVGGLIGFFRGQPDAIHLTLLALVWFPSLEFIPKLTDNQKFITIGRILLTLPIAYLGYQTGNWH